MVSNSNVSGDSRGGQAVSKVDMLTQSLTVTPAARLLKEKSLQQLPSYFAITYKFLRKHQIREPFLLHIIIISMASKVSCTHKTSSREREPEFKFVCDIWEELNLFLFWLPHL